MIGESESGNTKDPEKSKILLGMIQKMSGQSGMRVVDENVGEKERRSWSERRPVGY